MKCCGCGDCGQTASNVLDDFDEEEDDENKDRAEDHVMEFQKRKSAVWLSGQNQGIRETRRNVPDLSFEMRKLGGSMKKFKTVLIRKSIVG